jgi:hypothetical protein
MMNEMIKVSMLVIMALAELRSIAREAVKDGGGDGGVSTGTGFVWSWRWWRWWRKRLSWS